MRITDQMVFNSATLNIAIARERKQKAADAVASGQRVVHPGDDSGAAGLIASHRAFSVRDEMMGKVVQRATSELETAESAMGRIGEFVTRARELAMQLSNSNYQAVDRASAANEVQGLFDQAVAVLNTKHADRYLFGGNVDNAPPFDSAGNYNGDAAIRQVEIAPGILQDVSLRADVAIKGVGGGVDVLQVLSDLATALSTNDVEGVRSSLDGLDDSMGQVAISRGLAGSALGVLDSAHAALRASRDAEWVAISDLGEADIFQSATDLAFAEKGLDAALTAAAKSFQLTLINKL